MFLALPLQGELPRFPPGLLGVWRQCHSRLQVLLSEERASASAGVRVRRSAKAGKS